LESYWSQWCRDNAARLRPIDDRDVIERAKLNRRVIRRRRLRVRVAPTRGAKTVTEHVEDSTAWKFVATDVVLIAEIPRSKNRWNQANFDVTTFRIFFGARPGDNSQRVLLRNVTPEGLVDEIEVRPSVSVRSRNYRFELGAAAGLDYPEDGRPIAVFIRVSARMFLYTLTMPGGRSHREMADFLAARWTGRSDRMRRITTTVEELRRLGPRLPFWQEALQG